MSDTYVIFLRCARNWEEFSSSRKTIVQRGLTYEEALQRCREYNMNRSSDSIQKNRKMEFTKESYFGENR